MAQNQAGAKAAMFFILALLLLSATVKGQENCLCECMKVCRAKIKGADRDCARACNKACIAAGFYRYPKNGIVFCTPHSPPAKHSPPSKHSPPPVKHSPTAMAPSY